MEEIVAQFSTADGGNLTMIAVRDRQGKITRFKYQTEDSGGHIMCDDRSYDNVFYAAYRELNNMLDKHRPQALPLEPTRVGGLPFTRFEKLDDGAAAIQHIIREGPPPYTVNSRVLGSTARYHGKTFHVWKAWTGVFYLSGQVPGAYLGREIAEIMASYVIATGARLENE